ncbi:MAG TPA: transglycosylase domain-containing protein [Candidatus Dormibacteraeota bacterium]|nr:transglycosylase domain-containing protein [Candidatus Dormibacteraeota bacterium]
MDAQRTGKPGRRLPKWVYTRGAVVAIAVVVLAALATAYIGFTLRDMPDPGQDNVLARSIVVYDRSGKEIEQRNAQGQYHVVLKLSEMGKYAPAATLAAEDRNFYSEGAFDLKRIVKAIVDDLILRRPAEGASTITQQLVKQAFFGQQASKDPIRKIREALLAQEIDGKWSKDQILDEYLNITYYGENAYGVENAAQRYFGKHASELTLSEAALLAGLPEAPTYNDPYNNPDAAYARMHYVLGGLVDMGTIKRAQADAVDPLIADATARAQIQQAITADLQKGKPANLTSAAPHFVTYIQEQLKQQLADDPAYLNGNLVVTTTLDLTIQAKAQQSVTDGIAKLKRNANNGALLMIDSRTGQILAMVGSANYADNSIAGQYNVTLANRRPGSSFKPYVYETGFINGSLKPSTILQDTQQESRKLGGVPDFDGRFLGPLSAARALLLSRNVATEQAMQIAGTNNVINFAHSLGISTDLAENLSTAIGTSDVTMIDHASAYAAFANGGHKVTAYGILRVTDDKNNVLVDHSQPPGQGDVMTPAQAYSITKILRGYAHQWGLSFRWDTAGKSGTTDKFVDAWYMVYTPDWVVATWAGHTEGNNQAEIGMDEVFGNTMASYVTVPFVNSLSKPSAFKPVAGALSDCSSPLASASPQSTVSAEPQSGCPSPSGTPSPSASASASPTGVPTPTFSTVGPSPTPSPKPTPSPTPTAPAPTAPPSAPPSAPETTRMSRAA